MDLQQVLQALENADRAGDKAAAQELANLARQYQGGGMELDIPTFALPAAPPPGPPEGGFIPAVQRGFMQTGILLGDILPAMAGRAIGADEYAERQFREAAETEKKIQEKYAPAVASYKDVKGVGDAVTYAIESVGELVPSILPSLFTGGLAGVLGRGAVIAAKEAAETAARKQIAEKGVQALAEKEVMDQIRKAGIDAASKTALKYQTLGAVGGSSLQNIPEVYKNIKDETEEESLGSAMLFGGLNSLLDAALPLSLLAKARKAGIPGEEIVGAWYKRFGAGAAKGFATEGATEAAQEMSSAAAEKFVDNNIDFFSEKNLERFINAGLKGGLGGGVISGATDVMLGKKSLTEENKPLDQDIRDAQTDILARRALLDELRAQAAEEGRNKLDAESLKDLGFGPKYSLYGSLLNKDINDPVQAAEVISTLEAAVADPATKGRERVVASNTLEVINQYLETRGEPDVGQVVEEPSGAGVPVPPEPVTPAPTEGLGAVERTGVVPPVADVGAPVGGEGLQPAPVEAPVFAAPEPSQLPPIQPERLPTTRELITEQETQLAKDMERFQGLLQQQVRRFGLNDVAVQIDTDLREADGQYTKGLIKLAVDAADPVRALRHESIHAMKELGFFTPSQWNALVNRANESWINTYLQNRNVDGGFIEPGQTSRYDAYLKLFKDQGLNEAQAQEALIEEAISDAFGDFSQTQAPPGMMRAILNRMKNFFKAIKETVTGSGVTDPERLFGKIEKGEVVAPVDKTVAKQYPAEQVAASAKEREGEPERREQASLRRIKQVPTAGRPEPTRDGGGRDQGRVLAPLDGAPVISEATGPDPRIVSVAEAYAQRNGIPYKRQDAYVEVDEDRARRIAQAYEEMPHAPQDPAVKAAYADLIRQTRAQYDALIDAGYEFTFFDSNTDPYGGNPFNAMRDLRKNQRMAVYGTYDGFGTEGITAKAVDDNPMLADTGLRWKDQNGVEHMVTANDLFRAVHDAFGHGIEGAGFRARGEENAWQAHARLFTGPALGAITSETRGQNSWLNYGPYGEKNRTAKVEDTVFAEQKTGLMPEWTWQEGLTFEPKTADTKFSLRIMRGQEVPDIEGRITVDKIGKYFDDQIKDSFGRSLDYNNPKDFARALKIAKAEVDYQLKQEKSGLDWYEDDVRLAFEDTAKIIPQLNEPSNRILFSVIAGIMSPQTTARDNWFIAAKAYQHYVQTGDVPGINPENGKLWQGGTQSVNKRIQLEFLDRMIKDMGQAETINWLLADHTVKEINQFRNKYGNIKSGIDGKLNDVKRGIFAFGPKIGPFVSNINGIHDVTVDQWMIRTFNRYFGTMLGPNGEIINDPTEPQRRAVKDLVNKAAEDANIKPYQVQSLLWFYEQRLYDKIGLPTKSYGFSDGGRKFLEEAGGRGGQPSVRPAAAPTKEVAKASLRSPSTKEFKQFLEGSKAVDSEGRGLPYFHATLRDITAFKGGNPDAIFLSPDPEFSNAYFAQKLREAAQRPGQYLTPAEIRGAVRLLREYVYENYGRQSKMSKEMLETISEVESEGKDTGVYKFTGELGDAWAGNTDQMGAVERSMKTGRNIIPVYVNVQNPFDYESKDQVAKVLKQMMSDPSVKERYGFDPAPGGADLQAPENFMLRKTLERSEKDYAAAVRDRYREPILDGDWRTIESPEVQAAIRKLHDGFYVAEEGMYGDTVKNLAVYKPTQIKSATGNVGSYGQRPPTEAEAAQVGMEPAEALKAQEEGDIRFSLRSQIDPAINARIVQTTTAREEKSFPQRITQAIGPEGWSRFRAAALNRYNRLGEYDKMRIKQMGGADLLADANAESAALLSDLHAGIVAGSLGVYDKVGGVPVYNHHYVVERTVQTPTGPRTILVGGKISNRNTAEALARRYPNSKVKERGYTAVSNLNNTIKGPIAIFAPLAKLGDPYAYQAYQYWAGVKRGSKWVTQTQGPQKGQVVEQLFNDPADISKAEELRKKFLNDYKIDFNQIQKDWITYNDQLVQYMLDTGVISRETAKKFKDHGDYIPFYRQINGDDDAVGPRVFQSIAAVKAPRKIKGGEDPLGDFLENVVRNTQAAVQAGMKNVAARRAADVGMDLGFVSRVNQAQADPVNSFYVMENGQKIFYDSSDPLLIDSIKSLGLSEFPGIGLLAGPAGVLRNLVTKDPGFMLANMMRDSLSAWATSGVNMLPIAATLKNFTEALAGTSPEFKALLMSGVVGGYDYSQGTIDAAKQFGKELRKTAGARTVGEKAMTPFTSLWEGLEKGTQASDAATRIEVYKQTMRETGNEAEAMFRALEVMNFNRKGNNPIVRVATAAIPFLNARMQGLDVLYRAGLGKNTTSNAQEIQKAFWRRGMYMAALSTMYWALTHDDEEYKKQEQETKDNNWLFPSAGVRVPIPFEVGVLFKVIPERIAALIFGDDSAKDFTASMVRNLTSTLAVNPIPQTLLPLVEATTNFSFFTFRPIVGQGLEGVAAPYQIGPSTSRAGQLLAEMSKGLPSALQISPMKADAVIQGYTGTIGTYMSQLFDAVYDMHTDNPKASLRFEQLPVVKRFILDPDARGQVTAYFDLKNSVDEATRTSNLLERSMNFKEWGEYYSQNLGLFAVKDYILDMDKTLKEYRDMKNMIRTLPMAADQKRDSILAITRIENQLNANIELLKKQAGK